MPDVLRPYNPPPGIRRLFDELPELPRPNHAKHRDGLPIEARITALEIAMQSLKDRFHRLETQKESA
jgi:hypothetical protein